MRFINCYYMNGFSRHRCKFTYIYYNYTNSLLKQIKLKVTKVKNDSVGDAEIFNTSLYL